MKLAVAGKGGSGKTSISGTMARLLARSGRQVLAIDGDSNPNLALTLGIPPESIGEPSGVPDMHLADPEQVLAMAKRMDCLPSRVLLVGCQPQDADGLGEGLSPPVSRAVGVAAERIRETVGRWAGVA